jgi:hypothetical protein
MAPLTRPSVTSDKKCANTFSKSKAQWAEKAGLFEATELDLSGYGTIVNQTISCCEASLKQNVRPNAGLQKNFRGGI